jgi:hypothetical protein
MKEALFAWILSLLTLLAPNTPWRDTYAQTAEAFAVSAIEAPLFEGRRGVARTAALYASVAWFEATLRPDAEGDCVTKAGAAIESVGGRCPEGATPRSFCAFQIGVTNLAGLGLTRDAIQSDILACTRAANRMLRQSFQVCKGKPPSDRMAWYAAGGPTCGERGVKESRHRMTKAAWLFGVAPPPNAADRVD